MTEEPTKQILLRVPLSLHRKIEEKAKKEGRTRQNLILRILKERIA